jgi:uncharacterized membrane protein
MSRDPVSTPLRRGILAALALGWGWIAFASSPYFLAGPLHPFVIEKLPHSAGESWRAVLHVHVVSALFALPACLLLTSETFRRRALTAHRWLGRVTAAVALFALVPSGLFLARTASGGWLSSAGFVLSGAILAGALVRAVAAARGHRLAEHRRYMHHVLGQMAVAVVSRALLVGAGMVELDPDVAYLVSLWAPVLGVAWWVEHTHRPPQPVAAGVVAMSPVTPRFFAVVVLPALLSASSEAAPPSGVVDQIQAALVQPLTAQEAERSRFSRAVRPPSERRVRLAQQAPSVDAMGGQFYAFSIDQRWSGAGWTADAVVGCIYPATGQVFVQQEGTWLAASWLLGEPGAAPPATVCRAVGSG